MLELISYLFVLIPFFLMKPILFIGIIWLLVATFPFSLIFLLLLL